MLLHFFFLGLVLVLNLLELFLGVVGQLLLLLLLLVFRALLLVYLEPVDLGNELGLERARRQIRVHLT